MGKVAVPNPVANLTIITSTVPISFPFATRGCHSSTCGQGPRAKDRPEDPLRHAGMPLEYLWGWSPCRRPVGRLPLPGPSPAPPSGPLSDPPPGPLTGLLPVLFPAHPSGPLTGLLSGPLTGLLSGPPPARPSPPPRPALPSSRATLFFGKEDDGWPRNFINFLILEKEGQTRFLQ